MSAAQLSQATAYVVPKPKPKLVISSNKQTGKKTVAVEAAKNAQGETPSFDYSQIEDADARAKAQAVADRIHANIRSTDKNFLANGRELLAMKDDLKHGLFGKWLEAEFRWNRRTAQNYMAVAENVGDDYPLLKYLPSSVLYRLASGKKLDGVRTKVISAAKAYKPLSADIVLQMISQAQEDQPKPGIKEKAEARKKAAGEAIQLLQKALGKKVLGQLAALIDQAGKEFRPALKEFSDA